MNILLSPHNDDAELFASYTCLRYRPLVIVCLRSFVEAQWPNGPTYETREAETKAACNVLGCRYEQWEYPDNNPPWDDMRSELEALNALHAPDRVWAPLPEPGGHPHHNAIGEMARELFPNVTFYATYTHERGKTATGTLVEPQPGWEAVKRQAMSVYVSQATHPSTQASFNEWPIDEYLTEVR
jgi:LmbE family N-acetylglucosaminyl deacetylase